MKMDHMADKIRNAAVLAVLWFVFVIISVFGTEPAEVEAAMADNAYTQPFCADYYAFREARMKTTDRSYPGGWQEINGKRFYMVTDRQCYASGWKRFQGKNYYFDNDGYCVTGWIRTTAEVKWGTEARVMYFDPESAQMLTGYHVIDGIGRAFNNTGYLMVGRDNQLKVGGETYLTDNAGVCSHFVPALGGSFQNAAEVFPALSPDDVVSGDYEFQAKVNDNTTVETFGFDSSLFAGSSSSGYIEWCNVKDESLKGVIGAWYRNVGTYQGRTVDVKCVISDYKLQDLYGNEWGMIGFNREYIGIAQNGVEYAEMRMEFYDHESGEKIKVRGYATIADIDFSQACAITSPCEKIYVAQDCELLYMAGEGGSPVFADDLYNWKSRVDQDTSGQVLAYYDSDYFSFRFYMDGTMWESENGQVYYQGMNNGRHPHFTEADVVNDPELGSHSWQSYTASRFARVTTPYPPVKTVTDNDEADVEENTLSSISEGFSYKISQNVPLQSQEKFYYSSYQVKDELEACLAYVGARVEDDAGNDVTALFDVKNSGQTVSFTCKNPGDGAFYGKNYHYIINVKVKPDSDLEAYRNDNVYRIPNKASLIVKSSYEDEVYETNIVRTLIPVLVRDCSLKLVKQSSRDHAALTDAEFRIYEWNGAEYEEYAVLTNHGDGVYSVSGLAYTAKNGGWFKIRETKVPEGFSGAWEREFQISRNGGNGQVFQYTVENDPEEPKAALTVRKVDQSNGKSLAGAEFSVYEWNVNSRKYGTEPVCVLAEQAGGIYTDTEHLVRSEANDGWFKVVETKTPEGYIGVWEQEFQIAQGNGGVQEFQYTAENMRLAELTINKTIYAEEFYAPHGNVSFIFLISGTDLAGGEHNYARSVTFTEEYITKHTAEDGTVTLSTSVRNIPAGSYMIEEKKTSRYELTQANPMTDNIQIRIAEHENMQTGKTESVIEYAQADLSEKDGEVTFVNRKTSWDKYSHTDIVTNQFRIQQ